MTAVLRFAAMPQSATQRRAVAARGAGSNALIHTVLTVLAALGIAHVTALILISLYRHQTWNQQSTVTLERIESLEAEINRLERQADMARNNPQYLEELARRKGFVRKGERVILPSQPASILPEEPRR